MIAELIYTSVPKGLAVGSSGFTTVAYTDGLPRPLILACELLSSYRHLYPPGDPREALNPALFSHSLVTSMDRPFSVLSRVAAHGADYSGRTNKLAHHLVLSPERRPPQGPARLLATPGRMRTEWKDAPAELPYSPWFPPEKEPASVRAVQWERRTGWAGWAGILAGAFLDTPHRPAWLVFEPGIDLLPLIAEALALLPPAARWKVTFNSYVTALPKSSECLWRGCLPDSDLLARARSQPDALVLDLTAETPPPRIDSPWVRAAVDGQPPDWNAIRKKDERPESDRTASGSIKPKPLPVPHSRDTLPSSILEHPQRPRRRALSAGLLLLAAFAVGVWYWAVRQEDASIDCAATTPVPPPVAETVESPATPEPEPEPAVVSETVAETAVPEPLPDMVEPEPGPVYECIIPRLRIENARAWTLTGLPMDLVDAQQCAVYLIPGSRAVRTNGSLFASGLSGALAGRGDGEMTLAVHHARYGPDELRFRLQGQTLRVEGRRESLASLLAMDVSAENPPRRIVLFSTPWRLPANALVYSPQADRIEVSLTAFCGPDLAVRLASNGATDDWTARLAAGDLTAEILAQPDRPSGGFAFAWPDDIRAKLDLLRGIRDRQARRARPSPAENDAPLSPEQWDRLAECAADWAALGYNTRELLAPLNERIALRTDTDDPAALIDAYRTAPIDPSTAAEWAVRVQSMCDRAAARLDRALAPLRALETGIGLKLELFYRGQPAMIAGDN